MRFLWVLALGGLLGCGARPEVRPPPGGELPPVTDLSTVTLSAEEELRALLGGRAGGGSGEGPVRIAIVPFDVLGSGAEQAWLGEATADLLSAHLVETRGVSVLERGELSRLVDELERTRDESAQAQVATRVGRLLGAEYLVLGKLIPAGQGKFDGLATPVRIEDGTHQPSARFEVRATDVDQDLPEAARELASRMGLGEAAVLDAAPLDARQLERAAEARKAQYRGELVEAQAAYAEALGELSRAWSYEADYVALMADIGMEEYAVERAERVLARLPEELGTACVRSRVLAAQATAAQNLGRVTETRRAVAGAREAVRWAVACGDDNVLARALVAYARAVDDTDSGAADLALSKAADVLGEGASEWVRCEVAFYRYWHTVSRSAGEDDDRSASYLRIAEACEQAGNTRLSAVAMHNSAATSTSAAEKIPRQRRALEAARRVGGVTLDIRTVALAGYLRHAGRPGEADELLLEAMGRHLTAIQELRGPLGEPEVRLDDELLRRAGVEPRRGAARNGSPLLVKAHRRMLSSLLSTWAGVTDKSSRRQGDFYRRVAEQLDPSDDGESLVGREGEERAHVLLSRAGLPVTALSPESTPPRRDSGVDAWSAFQAVSDWFFATDSGDVERRAELARMARQVAEWLGSRDSLWKAARMEAIVHGDRGAIEEGLAALRVGRQYGGANVEAAYWLTGIEIWLVAKRDPREALALRPAFAEVARKLSEGRWVDELYAMGANGVGRDDALVRSALSALVEARDGLAARQDWATAGEASRHIGNLYRQAAHADGTAETVSEYVRRWELLRNTGDPLREGEALADVTYQLELLATHTYRDAARRQMRRDPRLLQLTDDVWRRAQELARQGRQRDAARLMMRISRWPETSGDRLTQALEWVEELRDSVEYPELEAELLVARGEANKDDVEARFRDSAAARALFLQAGLRLRASNTYRWDLGAQDDLDDLLPLFAECLQAAADERGFLWDCARGVMTAVVNHDGIAAGATDEQLRELARTAEIGVDQMPDMERASSRSGEMAWRSGTGTVALAARRRDLADPQIAAIERYYREVAPQPYMLATELSRLAAAARDHYPDLSVRLYRAFLEARGASDWYIAQVMDDAADAAHRARDAESERHFLDVGRRSARACNYLNAYVYDLHAARGALASGDFATVADAYQRATRVLESSYPSYEPMRMQLRLARAAALTRAGSARRAYEELSGIAQELRDRVENGRSETPCHDSLLVAFTASAAMAAGRCEDGRRWSEAATAMRRACTGRHVIDAPQNKTWTDGPDYLEQWQPPTECRQPLGDVRPLLVWLK